MDDVGAASKVHEQYAKIRVRIAGKQIPTPAVLQWGALKRVPLWRGWGSYEELTADVWQKIFTLLREHDAKLTVAVTATWADDMGTLHPFDQRFPQQTKVLRDAVAEGIIEIANHGLTHCVMADHAYLPQSFISNRKWHREFWDWVPADTHHEHLQRSQEILQRTFRSDAVTFVPPGNLWTETTEQAAAAAGIRYLTARSDRLPQVRERNGLTFVSEKTTEPFHDREIALYGVDWLKQLLRRTTSPYYTVQEYAAL